MFKAFKYRLYPTESQKKLLNKHFGAARFVYNIALETKKLSYSGTKTVVNRYELQKQLVELKKEHNWLSEIHAQSMQCEIMNLDQAMSSFLKGKKSYPTFKKKTGSQSYQIPQNIKFIDNKLSISKFREGIRIKVSTPIVGEIKSVTISKNSTGKFYASLLCKVNHIEKKAKPPLDKSSVGVDFGVKTFLTLSDGTTFSNNRYLKTSIGRLKILQRKASKKQKGSVNRRRANLKVALLNERISNQRLDYLQKTSTLIIKKYDTICIEDLNISGMVKNHNLARAIIDTGWNSFENMLKYKCLWHGKNLIYISRFYPSSKTCSNCGNIQNMPLSERVYNCTCGLSIDRDLNAAINIRNSGLGKPSVPVELPTLVGAVKQESNLTMPTLYIKD